MPPTSPPGRTAAVESSSTTTARARTMTGSERSVISSSSLDRTGSGRRCARIAGDNLLDVALAEYVRWWRERGVASAVGLYDVGDLALARATVRRAPRRRSDLSFVEKPPDPRSTLVARRPTSSTASSRADRASTWRRATRATSPGTSSRGSTPRAGLRVRASGRVVRHRHPDQLLEADNRYRGRAGLPTRSEYALD